MSNIYKKMEFHKKIKNLNDDNIIPFISEKQKKIKQLINSSTPLMRQKNHFDNPEEIIKENKAKNINDKQYIKHSLFLKKINLKENKNKYYIEGVFKLFNDENVFLDNIYKGKKIVIGKSRNKSLNDSNNYRVKEKYSSKKFNLIKPKSKNLSSSNINITRSNLFANDSILQTTRGRKMIWVGGKKNDNYINDEDLKNIYQECINRENINLKEDIEKLKNKSFVHTKNKDSSPENECNNILNLQSLVLNKYKLRNIETKKMIDRLLRHTSKNRDKLLINQINDYRLKKEKIDEIDINNIINENPNYKNKDFKEVEKKLQWLSSLREYQNNIKNNHIKSRCFSSNNKDLASSQNYNYSFDKRDIIFNLCGLKNPLYSQITPKMYKESEKIRDTLSSSKNPKNLKNKYFNISLDNFFTNNNKKSKINLYKGLNIKGKKLLNFEIELSKDLEGKKKKIVQYPYREEEITSKLFAKSYSVNNFFVPKSVKNTIELHYNNE